MTSDSNTNRPSTSKAATSSEKKMSPDQKRAELEMVMSREFFVEFKKSDRTRYLYNGYGVKGDKIQIRFDKTNFKVIVGKPSVAVTLTSMPLGKLKVTSVPAHIRRMLQTY
jgi:hypothetical protein